MGVGVGVVVIGGVFPLRGFSPLTSQKPRGRGGGGGLSSLPQATIIHSSLIRGVSELEVFDV